MEEEKLLAILRLQRSKAVGDILAKKLIVQVGDVAQIFKEKKTTLAKINGIGNHVLNHLFDTTNILKAEQEFQYIQEKNLQYSYFLEDDYPRNLLNCIDAPILIFKDGSIDLANDKIISIVAIRNERCFKTFAREVV